MGCGGDSPKCLPLKKNEAPPESSSSSAARVPLFQTPILLLVCFHKAMRTELSDLRHVTIAALDSITGACQGRDFVLEILQRFEFLRLAYKYHCIAEDEVIFLALDGRTKNVACTYSLEHKSIDGLFDSIFNRLDILLEEDEIISKQFQELVFCIGTLQTFICQHMLKEEEQVFPLLLQQFSPTEQASLVWRFMCSVPLVLLEDLLPWTISFLQPDEQQEFIHCIKEIVPDEKALQEAVISWLASTDKATFGAYTKTEGTLQTGDFVDMKKLLKSHSPKRFLEENRNCFKADCVHSDSGYNPVDGLHLWHVAVRKDLRKILEELYQLRSSRNFLNIDSTVVQLKFFTDVLTFYSNALEKLFHPVLNELVNGCLYPCNERFPNESNIEGLQRLLYCSLQDGTPLRKFVEKLCWELESFVVGVSKHFDFQEKEVFPIVRKNCSHEMQQQLLYVSLHIMPLGLLKCATTWFSACLSEDESSSILNSMKQGDSFVNKSFTALLHEWFRVGLSGKTSAENFREDLHQIFKSRCTIYKQFYDTTGSSSLSSNMQPCAGSNNRLKELISSNKGKNSIRPSSSRASSFSRNETSYLSGINLHIDFPGTMKTSHRFPESLDGRNLLGYSLHEPKPIDIIFFFHKALKKDLEYLVFGSAQLGENVAFLTEFFRRFHLLQFLFRIHSEAEDEVAFPALEAKGKFQNISHSYTMDHKLEVEQFRKIALILDEMSTLHVSISRVDSNTMDQVTLKHYHQLCMRLHDMCKSMRKLLTAHVHREEVELWPLFKECFSIEEQERIIGCILGRTDARILQDMIPWLMESLTPEEQHAMMSLWLQVTKNTMFDEWLREWWEGYDKAKVVEESDAPPSGTADPLEIVCNYLCGSNGQGGSVCTKSINFPEKDSPGANTKPLGNSEVDDRPEDSDRNQCTYTECTGPYAEGNKKKRSEEVENATNQINDPSQIFQTSQKSKYCECLLTLSEEDLMAAVIKISRDTSLDPQKKPTMIQTLLMSRWIVSQPSQLSAASNGKEFPGQHSSYQDPLGQTFGCKHYKRNCKLLAACCNQLYTCIRCHDEMADHQIDRRSITEMMCMKCLNIQPVGPTCSTPSCNNLSMARYFCRICKIFDDDRSRSIYHCPYCNLCRLGKGLGIGYFHCMTCNACMAIRLLKHTCREKCFMDNCPICNEDIFTSNSPVKSLPCGHLMHSTCFEAYTYTNYTCPICGKSLGDMQVYFKMLDALLTEERVVPNEYSSQTQVILCNDCGKKGTAPFHWLYHKCSFCGSYNTRLL